MSSSVLGRFQRLSESFDSGNDTNSISAEDPIEPHVMPEEEIMHKYWKISVSNISIFWHDFTNSQSFFYL